MSPPVIVHPYQICLPSLWPLQGYHPGGYEASGDGGPEYGIHFLCHSIRRLHGQRLGSNLQRRIQLSCTPFNEGCIQPQLHDVPVSPGPTAPCFNYQTSPDTNKPLNRYYHFLVSIGKVSGVYDEANSGNLHPGRLGNRTRNRLTAFHVHNVPAETFSASLFSVLNR